MATRVLVAKPGLDGHDRGAKIVARTLRDAGFEVIYTGIRQRIEDIVSIALQEDVALVGLSILSGAHVALTTRTVEALRAADAGDIAVVVGGTIPQADVPKLLDAGAAAVFPTGTPLDDACPRRARADRQPRSVGRSRSSERLGVMIGAERGDMARKVKKLVADIEWAEAAGLDTAWMPQVPNDFDCLTMVALMGAHTSRIELGTAVVPLQAQHPIALGPPGAVGACGGRRAAGARRRPVAPLDRARHARHPVREAGRLHPRLPRGAQRRARPDRATVDVENDSFTVHNPTVLGAETPMPVLVAALGPVMLQIAGEHADGTVLWMADEKGDRRPHRAADHQGRRRRGPAGAAHRRGHPGVPVRQLRDRRRQGARQPHPRRGRDVAQLPAAAGPRRCPRRRRPVRGRRRGGDPGAVPQFADAGVTDLSVRLLPIGDNRDELVASKYRTREVIARARQRCDERLRDEPRHR